MWGHNLILDQYASVDRSPSASGGSATVRWPLARQVYVAHSRAEAEDALARQAAVTRRTIDVSRSPQAGGSHVLGYAEALVSTAARGLRGSGRV
jgi:hypothetical protein